MLEPGQVVDRYTVEGLLGEGGMASVYRVRHNTLGSFHALKLLKVQSEAIRRRLVTEGQVQASLRHPNVVAVTDVLFVGDQPGLVMELVEGPTLHDWLAEYQPSMEQAESLFRGIVAGVSRAHRAGVLHRDLKPGNVLLDSLDGVIIPKVTDFGLAKVLAEDPTHSQTRSGMPMGTPQYMAPEQIRNARDVDQRADIWALGCILYELVAGRRPFDGPDIIELYGTIGAGRYTPITELVPGLPPHLVEVIGACLTPEPEHRIADCETLKAALSGQPLEDTVPGGAGRLDDAVHRWEGRRAVPLVADQTQAPGETQALDTLPAPSWAPAVTAAPSAPTRTSPPTRQRNLALLVLAGGAALAVLGFAVVALLLWTQSGQPPLEAATTPEPTTTAADVAPAAPVAVETAPTAPAETPSVSAPPTSATSPPRSAPASKPRATGRVEVVGEVERLVLHAGGKEYEPGEVPAGRYTATVTFAGRGVGSVNPFSVRAGETTTLACDSAFVMCRVK